MKSYLIAIETDEQSANQLIVQLQTLGPCLKIMNNVMLLQTGLAATDVRDYVVNIVSAEKVFVTGVQLSVAWRNIGVDTVTLKKMYNVQD